MIKKICYALALGIAAALFAFWLDGRGWLERIEFTTWNWRVNVRSRPGVATEDIKIIVVDEESLQWAADELRLPWPWPREVYSAILQFLSRGGARAVAFDVLFLDHSFRDAADDPLFGEAIREGPPFVAAAFLGDPGGRYTNWPSHIPDHSLNVTGFEAWRGERTLSDMRMERVAMPIPAVATNATILGDVRGVPDRDGIIRRVHLFREFDGRFVPSLGFGTYMAAQSPSRGRLPELRMEGNRILSGRRRIPVDAEGRSILRYRGPPGTHERFQAAQLIQDEIRIQSGERPRLSPVVFDNKYVLLGFSAPGLLDLRPTPMSPVTPGVEVHATMLDNFLSNDFVRTLPRNVQLLLLMVLAGCGAMVIVFSRRVWSLAAWFIALLSLPSAIGFYLYEFSLWWPIVPQTVALAVSMVGGLTINYALEGRQKHFIKSAFRHYLSPAVIDQILQNPQQLKLGGERRTLTIFFSDLAGFSAISEKLNAEQLTTLLNDYLSDMTELILEEGGTLDKYEGDAIIAFWNAPLAQEDHAERAVRAALKCQKRLAERRPEFLERTGCELTMRIGVNTGDVVVGNMGSRERFDYTVLGDAANLASRLEGANKVFGTAIMVAESTWAAAGDGFVGRPIGRIRVVGRKTPEQVFEPLALTSESIAVSLSEFAKAMEACEQGNYEAAAELFDQWTNDPLSCTYAQRCRRLSSASGETWDGIWNLTEK